MNVTFELQPTLQGDLLLLRPLRQDDYDSLYAVASDPLIWEQHPSWDRYKEEVFQAFFRDAMDSGGALIAIEASTGRIIGSSRFYGYDPEKREIEIGWSFLSRSCWGGTYNGEMKRLMLQHAFKWVESVLFIIGPKNMRSRRAVEKLGGTLVETCQVRGQERVVYRLTPSTYRP